MEKLVSKLYNRIHINSINMSDQGLLTSGGLGFSIKYAPMTVEVSYNEELKCNVIEGFNAERAEAIIASLGSKYSVPETGWRIKVEQHLKPHIGLGSTTQIESQIVASCLKISGGKNPEYQDFITSGIGLESGIGLKCFHKNGFHIDFGYWKNRNKITKINSSYASAESLYFRLPDEWKVLLIVPKEYTSISGQAEQGFWERILPADVTEAHKISFYTLMGVIPAVMEKNFNSFMEALIAVCGHGTKPYEIELNHKYIKSVYEDVNDTFGFCGLSSLGPTCYSFIENSAGQSEKLDQLKQRHNDFDFVLTELAYE